MKCARIQNHPQKSGSRLRDRHRSEGSKLEPGNPGTALRQTGGSGFPKVEDLRVRIFAARRERSGVRLGLAQSGDAIAWFPLTPLLEQRDALESFEDIALGTQRGGGAQTAML